MKSIKYLLFISLLLTYSCGARISAGKQISVVDVNQLERMLERKQFRQIVDVRSLQEFTEGHLPGAVNIDVRSAGFKEALKQLNPKYKTLVYCASGVRTKTAVDIMSGEDFEDVYWLKGGLSEWKRKGKELEK